MRLRFAAHSEIGLVRKNNQDSGYASPNLLVVADGMGGAAAGDLASAVAVDTICQIDRPTAGEQMLEVLSAALHQANARIAALVDQDYALEGMGTTVTGVLFDGTQFGLAHIGDSRAYLMHESRLERLTHDHSWVQSLVDSGRISEVEATVHPHRSLLLKVLNGQPANDPDVTLVPVEPGDRLLLCSDGLCGLVDDPVIEAAMRTPDLDSALRQLVAEARAEGGIDNITVILADVVESTVSEQPVVLGAAAELAIPATGSAGRLIGAGSSPVDPDARDTEEADRTGRASAAAPAGDVGARTIGTETQSASSDDEARYSPQPPRTGGLGRRLVLVVLAVLVVGGALASAYAWTRTQYFVGAAGDRVAIFQGLNERLPGVPLSRIYELQPLAVSALPPYYQQRVRASIDVPSLDGARLTVTELADAARRCAGAAPRAGSPPTPGPSPSASASARPSAANTPAPTPLASTPKSSAVMSAPPTQTPPAASSAAPRTPATANPPAATPGVDC